jgi:hypothetical protein
MAHRLRHVLSRRGTDTEVIDEAVAAVEAAMELRDGAAIAGAGAPPDLRGRMAAALNVFRSALSRPGLPLVTVLEDLHLADPSSVDILRTTLDGPPLEGAEPRWHLAPPGDDDDESASAAARFDLRIESTSWPPPSATSWSATAWPRRHPRGHRRRGPVRQATPPPHEEVAAATSCTRAPWAAPRGHRAL